MMKQICLLLVSLIFTLFIIKDTWADELSYSVKAEIPDNQIDQNLNYFDLLIKPEEKQDIAINITNNSNEIKNFNICVNNALTTTNGNIDYNQHGLQTDESMKISIEELVQNTHEKIEIKPGETQRVIFHISMPKEKVEGMILGGINITQDHDYKEEEKQNILVKNMYSYIIGIKIRQELEPVTPDLHLNEIQTGLVNNASSVIANLQNSTATLLRNVSIEAQITKKEDNTIVLKTKKENMSIAPNTNFDFLINSHHEMITSGEYTLDISVSSDQGNWTFTKDFTVKNKQTIPSEVKYKNNQSIKDYNLLDITLFFIFLVIISYIIYRIRKKR